MAAASTGKQGKMVASAAAAASIAPLPQEQCTCASMVAYVRRRVAHETPEFAQSSLAAGVAG